MLRKIGFINKLNLKLMPERCQYGDRSYSKSLSYYQLKETPTGLNTTNFKGDAPKHKIVKVSTQQNTLPKKIAYMNA